MHAARSPLRQRHRWRALRPPGSRRCDVARAGKWWCAALRAGRAQPAGSPRKAVLVWSSYARHASPPRRPPSSPLRRAAAEAVTLLRPTQPLRCFRAHLPCLSTCCGSFLCPSHLFPLLSHRCSSAGHPVPYSPCFLLWPAPISCNLRPHAGNSATSMLVQRQLERDRWKAVTGGKQVAMPAPCGEAPDPGGWQAHAPAAHIQSARYRTY